MTQAQPFHILLVEDDPGDAGLVKHAVLDAAITCDLKHVRDGEEALAYLRRQPPFEDARRPDLVLLDLNMPRMDGRKFLSTVRAEEALKALPIVVLTTSTAERDIESSYALGANSFVSKPVDLDAFFRMIEHVEQYWFSVVRLPRE